uniref:Reverse transcriptase domain-containing protein n=1 Tax=Tanacetum cinerariifolium TaxID=118510 RepID=A0A6L2LG43_TANCI|nr:hypothetical protein [Tanacetum cinerariifolium]
MPHPDPNNTYTKPPSEIQILEFIKTLSYDEDSETKKIVVSIMDEFKWQIVKRSSRTTKMSNLLYTRFTKLIIDYILSHNKSIPRRSYSKLHSSQDDQPITKLLNTTNGDYKFGLKVLDAINSDAIKNKVGYTYYMAKKVESEKAKIIDEPEEQHVSPVKSGRGKGFMCYGDQVANVPNKLKKDVVPRKTRSLTIAEETVVDKTKESANETDESDMDLSNDNPHRDDDAARYDTVFKVPPYLFNYPTRRLTMEEILAKFINEGKRKHEEMEIFIKEFRTTNELLLKERSNLLSELKIEVRELSKVMCNVLIPKNKVNGETTRGGKMTFEATSSKEINETRINENEPPRFEQDVQKKPHDNDVKNKSSSICERTTQPLVKLQQSSIPFPNRTMNERCSTVLLNKLPLKEKDHRSFTIPCQVLEKHKEAEDLAAYHLSRFENPHMKVLTKREIADKFFDEHLMVLKSKFNNDEPWEIADKFFDEHLMVLKSKFNNDEPWYVDFVNYIVGKIVPLNWTFEKRKRCVAGSETLKILAHCHSGPTGGHHSANVTAKKVYESRFYWPSVFNDANELRGDKDFKVCDNVLLYNSRLKMYHGQLKSKWSDLNIVKMVYLYGAVEIIDKNGFKFKVNGQQLKKYYEGDIKKEDDEVIEFENGVT